LEAESRENPEAVPVIPVGNQNLLLQDLYPDPTPLKGRTLRVKGFLIKDAAGDRINVVSMNTLSSQCSP
jgi:hypothetical protein